MTTPIQQAKQDLAKKLNLEKSLQRMVSNIFDGMIRDFKREYVKTNSIIIASAYRDDFNDALNTHYFDVSNKFKRSLRKDQTDDEIDEALLPWFTRRALEQSQIITETNQSQLVKAVGEAMTSLQEEGMEVNPTNIALVAGNILQTRFDARTVTIGLTETQNPAEVTKLTEAEVVGGLTPFVVSAIPQPASTLTKEWTTIVDGKQRSSHFEAHRQRVPTNKSFIVQSQSLKFPGDTSQGATIDNVANCRCSAYYG